MKIMQSIERALFGATAEEAVEMRIQLAEQRIGQRLIAALEQDSDSPAEDQDQPTENASGNASA